MAASSLSGWNESTDVSTADIHKYKNKKCIELHPTIRPLIFISIPANATSLIF
jgi:hypothetical protein